MSLTYVQLVVNITTTNVWTQLLNGNGGAAYTVPAGKIGVCDLLKAINIGANSMTVEFAISTNSTIDDAERIVLPVTITQNQQYLEFAVHILKASEGLWARAVGTTPNVTFRASLVER